MYQLFSELDNPIPASRKKKKKKEVCVTIHSGAKVYFIFKL